MARVKIHYLRESKALYGEEGIAPATSHSCGIDLRACFAEEKTCSEGKISIEAGERYPIPTGIALEICEPNIAGFLYSRSGLGAKTGLTVAQGVGVIDPDYRGEIIAFMLNTSKQAICVEKGERIAQLVFQPYVPVSFEESEELSQTERGSGGYGHTGKK